jgi:hypothetical protein
MTDDRRQPRERPACSSPSSVVCRLSSVVFLLAVLVSGRALAFIEALYSLDQVLNESSHVAVGKLELVDRERRVLVATVGRALKGPQEFTKVKMMLGLAAEGHAPYVLNQAQVGGPFILFYKRDGNNLYSISHFGDHWQQFYATDEGDRSQVWWRMSHIEIRMNRAFNGTTADLVKLTEDVLAKRVKAPPPDPAVPPLDTTKQGPPVPAQPEDPRDGLEAVEGWYVDESWARPARLSIDESRERGRLLTLRCAGPAAPPRVKLAVVLLLHMDLSAFTHFGFEVDSDSDRPVTVSVAFGAAPDWAMFESPSVIVPAGASRVLVSFLLTGARFKSQASRWEHTQPLPNGGRIDKIMLIFEGLPDGAAIVLNRIRATRGGFRRQIAFPHAEGGTRGIAWASVNGDDRLGAVLSAPKGNILLIQGPLGFAEATAELGLAGGSTSAGWADYEGEGHPSLVLGGAAGPPRAAIRLLTRAGGRFRDDSKRLPAPVSQERVAESAVWVDYNGDGLPDLLVAHGEYGLSLYENTGKGIEGKWFRDVSERVGLGPKSLPPEGFTPSGGFLAVADYDGDGYTDIFYTLGQGLLFHNERGRGFKLDAKSGIDLPGGAVYPRGALFADYDNDGNLDLLVPGPTGPRLYHNNNDGTFTDVTSSAGDLAKATGPCLAAAWGDANNDGFLDLFVCFPTTGGRLYLGDGKGRFRDVTAEAGLDRVRSVVSASFADVDGDGRLDLLLDLGDKAVLALGEMDVAPNCGSLAVRVGVRKGLIGAVVRVQDARGRPMGLRTLAGAEGWGGQASPVAHFGLPVGRYRVSVCLSDGRVAEKEVAIEPKAAKLLFGEGDFK